MKGCLSGEGAGGMSDLYLLGFRVNKCYGNELTFLAVSENPSQTHPLQINLAVASRAPTTVFPGLIC